VSSLKLVTLPNRRTFRGFH